MNAAPQTPQPGLTSTDQNQPDDDSIYLPALPPQPEEEATTPAAKTPAPKPSRGGIPAIPALTIGTGSAVTAVSSAGLAAGPAGAVVAAAVLATAATVAAVARAPRSRAAARGGRQAGRVQTARRDAANRAGSRQAAGHRSTGLLTPRPAVSQRKGAVPAARTATTAASTRTGGLTTAGAGALRGLGAARHVQAVRQARGEAAAQPRNQQRTEQTAARRQVADARREAKREAKARRQQEATAQQQRTRGAHAAGRVSTAGTQPRGRVADRLDRRRQARRLVQDAKAQGRVDRRVAGIREKARVRQDQAQAKAREKARSRALRRSAARFHGRRVLAALAATPMGLLSLLLSLPMRKLGLAAPRWGRRIYRRLVGAALTARQQRDQDAEQTAAQDQQQPAVQAEEDTVQLRKLDRVSDAPLDTDTTTPAADAASIYQGDLMGLFDFRGAAEDMHTQAQQGEISGMLAVLRSIETMPDAITYIANTFGVVAERLSPEEAPLDPAVTDSLMEVYGLLVKAADAASEVAEVFKKKHEPEIQRLEDPRIGEELWDVTRNNDVEEDV